MRIFDFDGVIGSAFGEALFNLPETPTDATFMSAAQKRFRLKAQGEKRICLRYMLIQRTLWDMSMGIEEGPLFTEAANGEPFIILTARSDLYAVKRMHRFLDFHGMEPSRTFHVGSTEKHTVVEMLMRALPDEQLTFWDDNQQHINGVNGLNNSRVTSIKVDNDMEAMYARASTFYNKQLLEYIT